VPLSCYEFFSTEKGALFEIWRIKKGTVLFKEAYRFESCQFLKSHFPIFRFFLEIEVEKIPKKADRMRFYTHPI